eukprot:s556_g16.t1
MNFHEALERSWGEHGVLSSAKKKVVGALRVDELGAEIDGTGGILGPSVERLLKLIQTTILVLSKPVLRRKWVQVVAGRWVHILSFRRPGMAFFDDLWKFASGTEKGVKIEMLTRKELFGVCLGAMLLRTNLKAELSENTTASDASSTGGAVGRSIKLRTEGEEFACMDRQGLSQGKPIPVMALSLFNGIGCAYRCYDLCRLSPAVCIAYELSPEANRISARRWPALQIFGDVKTLSIEDMRSWRYKYPEVVEIHPWAGFPCTDLCSAKWGRQNLEGDAGSLFWEVIRILKQIKQVFGFDFVVRYAIENVASMDRDAEQEISRTLGVRPLRMDPADVVPIHRPRFCWCNVGLEPMDHVWIEEKPYWLEVHMEHAYPLVEQWLEEGACWPGGEDGTILPTAMKSIKRARPPPKPAGLERASYSAVQRWEADNYCFPPYQSPLAGLGCGLPLSRLYAEYMGGRVKLQTMPRSDSQMVTFTTLSPTSLPTFVHEEFSSRTPQAVLAISSNFRGLAVPASSRYILERERIDSIRPPAWGKIKTCWPVRCFHDLSMDLGEISLAAIRGIFALEHMPSGGLGGLRHLLHEHEERVPVTGRIRDFPVQASPAIGSTTLESVLFTYAGVADGDELTLDPEVHMIVSEDNAMLNTGIFFARSSTWVTNLLRRVWGSDDSPWINHPWWENAAFTWQFLKDNPQKFAFEDLEELSLSERSTISTTVTLQLLSSHYVTLSA